jgi:hypothetical protein
MAKPYKIFHDFITRLSFYLFDYTALVSKQSREFSHDFNFVAYFEFGIGHFCRHTSASARLRPFESTA